MKACGDDMLDTLCPMHMRIGRTGHILHAGPTVCKMCGDDPVGQRLLELIRIIRPRGVYELSDLVGQSGKKLQIVLRRDPDLRLKAVILPHGNDMVLDMSLGISVQEAVVRFGLSNRDFAPTDQTVELLYLIEAKSAAMTESRRLNTQLFGAKEKAETAAFTDTLTGLQNRRALGRVLQRLIRGNVAFTCMQMDLDFFKAVNDTHGHAAGDHVLIHVAQVLRHETRAVDTVARLGGDEFAIILHNMVRPDRIEKIAMRIIEKISKPVPYENNLCRISASIGSAISLDYEHPIASRILKDADQALYQSKHLGRGQHHFAVQSHAGAALVQANLQ